MSLIWEEGKGENGVLQQYFGFGNQQDFRVFWDERKSIRSGQRQEAFKSLQKPTIFSNRIFSLKAQIVLATFCYNRYYRWLTVDPLGDGAFLKSSRTSDLLSLGG